MATNIKLYPWFEGCRNLVFWQAIWFLYFQEQLSVAEAIALAAAYDIATAILEVPSGYLSDRVGRRITLVAALLATMFGALLIGLGGGFTVFVCAQILFGAGSAFASGTNSALLYDSLLAEGRESEVAWHEVQAWRFSFAALAISAFTGGWMATQFAPLPFLMSALAALVGLFMVLWFREPKRGEPTGDEVSPTYQIRTVFSALRDPALAWLFALAVGMYVFSHVPFVFGQPFILQALANIGLAADTPIASGGISAAMMLVSVAASWFAIPLATRIGSKAMLFIALAMQIGLILVLMVTVHPAAIAVLALRMVPNAFSRPFILANTQPRLRSAYRATYLSLQGLVGRVALAGSLFAAAFAVPQGSVMQHDTMQGVLLWYVLAGLAMLFGLAATASRVALEDGGKGDEGGPAANGGG